jgi:hypothetical protein
MNDANIGRFEEKLEKPQVRWQLYTSRLRRGEAESYMGGSTLHVFVITDGKSTTVGNDASDVDAFVDIGRQFDGKCAVGMYTANDVGTCRPGA